MAASNTSVAYVRMDEFKNTVTNFGSELANLRQKIAAASSRKKELQLTLEKFRAEAAELNCTLNALRGKEVEETERENFHLATVADLTDQIKIYKSKLDDIRTKNTALQDTVTQGVCEFECRCRDLLKRFQTLQLKDMAEESPTEILTEDEVREMEGYVEQLEAKVENLSGTCGLDLPLDYLQNLVDSVKQKVESLEEECKSLQTQLLEQQQLYQKFCNA